MIKHENIIKIKKNIHEMNVLMIILDA